MTGSPEFIGRAEVQDIRKEGGFVVKILSPELTNASIPPDSQRSIAIARAIRTAEENAGSKRDKRANVKKRGFSRR